MSLILKLQALDNHIDDWLDRTFPPVGRINRWCNRHRKWIWLWFWFLLIVLLIINKPSGL